MTVSKKWNMTLCGKHIQQLKRHDKIIDASRQLRNRNEANEIRIYDTYAGIVLYNTYGQEIAEALIDLDDIDRCKEYKWYVNDDKNYVCANNKNGGKFKLHRFIKNVSDKEKDKIIDHINRNTYDNRKCNLRIVNKQQNTWNHSIFSTSTTGVTGVYWHKRKCNWQASITVDLKKLHLGYFDNFDDAVKARKDAEVKYYGEFSPNN